MSAIAYHITIGTYGTRLHGGVALTVERPHNKPGDPFVTADPKRELAMRDKMKEPPCHFSESQCLFVELIIPAICERGSWLYHLAACQDDHIHLLVSSQVEPKKIRRWFKTWLTQSLNEQYGPRTWLVDAGSTKWINDEHYFQKACAYVRRQRTTQDHDEEQ